MEEGNSVERLAGDAPMGARVWWHGHVVLPPRRCPHPRAHRDACEFKSMQRRSTMSCSDCIRSLTCTIPVSGMKPFIHEVEVLV